MEVNEKSANEVKRNVISSSTPEIQLVNVTACLDDNEEAEAYFSSPIPVVRQNSISLSDNKVKMVLKEINAALSTESGSPRGLFYALCAVHILMLATLFTGNVFSYDIYTLYSGDFIFLFGTILILFCLFLSILTVKQLRPLFLSQLPLAESHIPQSYQIGLLTHLKVNEIFYTPEQDQKILQIFKLTQIFGLLGMLPLYVMLGYSAVTSFGVSDSVTNTVSAIITIIWLFCIMFVLTTAVLFAHIASSSVCVRLTEAIQQIEALAQQSDHTQVPESGLELSDEQWRCRVVDKTLDVVKLYIPMLSEGLQYLTLLIASTSFLMALAMACWTVAPVVNQYNPDTDSLWFTQLSRGMFAYAMCVFLTFPGFILSPPAEVSDLCLRLFTSLNELRMSAMTLEVHQRVIMLETALRNLNRGYGPGFTVVGTVVDKRELIPIFILSFML